MLLIKNGLVVDPKNNINEVTDILVSDGIIKEIAKNISCPDADIIDASGLTVAPGLVDLHVHFRDPGLEYKENIESGSRAAAHGGVTTVVCMPNTVPPVDNKALVEYIKKRGNDVGLVNVFTAGCITKGQEGKELSEIGELKAAGAVAITDDGKPVKSSGLMHRALEYANMFDMLVMSHSEDLDLVDGGSMNEGYMSAYLGLKGIPKTAESTAVSRDVLIAEETGSRLHICHVSTKNSIEAIRAAKKRGARITAETAPHYFTLTDRACDGYNTNAKMNPPLRDEEDVEAVIEALIDGTIDSIATDHAPHHIDEKEVEFEKASNGIIGLETSLALGVTYLVKTGRLSMTELIKKMSTVPAEIIGCGRGSLGKGCPADIVIFDPNKEFTLDASKLASKSKNTPYDGYNLFGEVEMTITGGKVVYSHQ